MIIMIMVMFRDDITFSSFLKSFLNQFSHVSHQNETKNLLYKIQTQIWWCLDTYENQKVTKSADVSIFHNVVAILAP